MTRLAEANRATGKPEVPKLSNFPAQQHHNGARGRQAAGGPSSVGSPGLGAALATRVRSALRQELTPGTQRHAAGTAASYTATPKSDAMPARPVA